MTAWMDCPGQIWDECPTRQTLVRERDAYKATLERIAQGDVPNVTFAEPDLISEFAQSALDEQKGET